MGWIRWFSEIGMRDVSTVGGKNASLGCDIAKQKAVDPTPDTVSVKHRQQSTSASATRA